MYRYVIKRILWLIPIIICVSFVVYALIDLAPGSVIDSMINDEMTDDDINLLKARYNLDKPMVYRFAIYMFKLAQGDLGVSDVNGLSVWDTYLERLPNTLVLAAASLTIGAVCGVPLGIYAARHSTKMGDTVATTFSLMGISMPNFWVALLLLLLFSLTLGWFPSSGNRAGIRSLVLPAISSSFGLMAGVTRQTRSSMLEVLNADYLRTARGKGVSERAVIRKHALSNAWIPILTTVGTSLAFAISGSAITEAVFAWPGVGRMTVEAVGRRDVTTVCGTVILTTTFYVLVQLLVDLAYAFVDPRIRAQYTGGGRRRKKA